MNAEVFESYAAAEEAGVSSKQLLRFLKEAHKLRNKVQFHSMILLRHGKVVFRFNWAPYDDRTPHMLFSLSKSFTSAAAGFAVSEGLLNWDSRVTDILPEEIDESRIDELSQITLRSLLCMGSGLDEKSDSPSPDPNITWARHVLSHRLVRAPYTHFHYNTFGTYLVSCMVQKVTGMKLTDYLDSRLFAPLGIEKPDWDTSPQGICCGGFGLHLSSESIARFGQCLLQKGVWQGRQILPEGWVDFATREHIANYDGTPQEGNEWGQGYGLQFWRCMDGRYRGDGAFGQACIVDESRDAVLAVTCATNDMGEEFRLIREYIFTAFDADKGNAADKRKLAEKSRELSYADTLDDDDSVKTLPEGVFNSDNGSMKFGIELSNFSFDIIRLTLHFDPSGQNKAEFYLTRGRFSFAAFNPYLRTRYFGGYAWRKGKLYINLRSIDGPDTMEGTFSLTSDKITFNGLGIHAPDGRVVFKKA